MGRRKKDKFKVFLKLKGQEKEVEEYLKGIGADYERKDEEKETIFEVKGEFRLLGDISLHLYTQFKFDDFIALDEAGHAFLCW